VPEVAKSAIALELSKNHIEVEESDDENFIEEVDDDIPCIKIYDFKINKNPLANKTNLKSPTSFL
jgi:hypothetical protein